MFAYSQNYIVDALKYTGYTVQLDEGEQLFSKREKISATLTDESIKSYLGKFGLDNKFHEWYVENSAKNVDIDKMFWPENCDTMDLEIKSQIHFRLMWAEIKTQEQLEKLKTLSAEQQTELITNFNNIGLLVRIFGKLPNTQSADYDWLHNMTDDAFDQLTLKI